MLTKYEIEEVKKEENKKDNEIGFSNVVIEEPVTFVHHGDWIEYRPTFRNSYDNIPF